MTPRAPRPRALTRVCLTACSLGLLSLAAAASDPPFGAAVEVSAFGAQTGADWLFAVDMDGDLDLDLLTTSNFEHRTVWYRNEDGFGQSWSEHVVDDTASGSQEHAAPADLDGDGDLDVVIARLANDEVIWQENADGLGTSWTEHPIAPSLPGVQIGVLPADFDGDGDVDVVTSFLDGSLKETHLYENLGTGLGWITHVIATDFADALQAADVDGDGDLDVCAESGTAVPAALEVVWFENLGGLVFARNTVGTPTASVTRLEVADLDGDGDQDMVHTDATADEVLWHENLDGAGGAWATHTVQSGLANPLHLEAADVDGDLDLDLVLSWHGVSGDWGVLYVENALGDGSSWLPSAVHTNIPGPLTAVDLDRDGDTDVASTSTSTIVYHPNETYVDLGDGLAGTGGVEPRYKMTGSLDAGSNLLISIKQGQPSALGYLVIGASALSLPFKGGTMVPNVDLFVPVPLGPQGVFENHSSFPAGVPSGTPVWAQAWLVDVGGPNGFSATNALLATTP